MKTGDEMRYSRRLNRMHWNQCVRFYIGCIRDIEGTGQDDQEFRLRRAIKNTLKHRARYTFYDHEAL